MIPSITLGESKDEVCCRVISPAYAGTPLSGMGAARQGGRLWFVQCFFNLVLTCLVLFTFKGGGKRFAEIGDQAFHVTVQLAACPRWHTQHARFIRLDEIVDIAPVGRRWFTGGFLFKMVTH